MVPAKAPPAIPPPPTPTASPKLTPAQPIAELDLFAIDARAKAATPGPWTTDGGNVVETEHPAGDGSYEGDRADVCEVLHYRAPGSAVHHGTALFIAAAREDVPALVAEVHRLRRAVESAHMVLVAGDAARARSILGTTLDAGRAAIARKP